MATYTNPFANGSDAQLGVATAMPLPTGGSDDSRSLLDADYNAYADIHSPLTPPDPHRFSSLSPSIGMDSQRDSIVSEANSAQAFSAAPAPLAGAGLGEMSALAGSKEGNFGDEPMADAPAWARPAKKTNRRLWWLVGIAGLLVVAAAVAVPVGLVFGRKDSSKTASSSDNDGDSNSNPNGTDNPPRVAVTTGGDGSTVTTEDGDTFTYNNKFGGFWVWDPEDPFNNNAQPNSWTPPLNTTWKWGVDKVYGVNLGGLFVLEPFISPALFQKYLNGNGTSIDVVDEWTLSQAMAADTSDGGGLGQLEEHYKTFITEEDIAQIAGAGLNWIRLPIPFWAIDKWDTTDDQEPFQARTCWKYILRVFRWCRKYGLRINLDLHTAPGSQNSYNHSGKSGQINFLAGVMGFANAQRMLDYIRIFTEFISQDEYKDLITMFSIINEPRTSNIGRDTMSNFYLQAYDMMRDITGIGEGKGAFITIHDGFEGPAVWADFLPGADRVGIDFHPYFAFNGQPNTDPIEAWPPRPCGWGTTVNNSRTAFGVTIGGEFSNAINDCGLFVNGVTNPHNYGGDCSFWEDSTQWNQTIKNGLNEFALTSMDALQDFFFWTWKIGNSSVTNTVQSPLWSYKAGLEGGWMSKDPRSAVGACASLGVTGPQFDGTFSAWQTGGAGAGTIADNVRSSYTAWPPTSISGVDNVAFVPTYTATGTVSTLPPDTFTAAPKTLSIGNGWADSADTSGGITEVAGCTYPNPWDSAGATLPTTTCTGAAARLARRTPPPIA